jgi:hypothetical protein
MDKSIIEDIKEGILVLKVIVESENIKLIFTCPNCETEHDLAKLVELAVENNLKELPDCTCFHCHCAFNLSETKEFEDIRKNFLKAFVRVIAKMKNIFKDENSLNQFFDEIVKQK